MKKGVPPLVTWLVCLAALAAAFWSMPAPSPGPEPWEAAVGSHLIHGLRSELNPSMIMPLQSTLAGLVYEASQARAADALASSWYATLVLAFTLGTLLHSPLAGGLSALLVSRISVPGLDYPSFYSLLVLLAANCLVWAGRSPGVAQGLALGGAIGLGLLERSPLLLFPLAAAAYAFLAQRTTPKRMRSYAAALLLPPVIMLLPWVRMNHALHRKFIPLEDGKAAGLMITAAMGVVTTTEGDHLSLVSLPEGASPTAWTAGQILGHPWRYLAGAAARLRFVVSLHPVLFLLAAAALARWRDRHEFRLIGLLAAYFVAVHCAVISVRPRYFEPLWPLLSALTASLASDLLRPAPTPAAPRLCAALAGSVYALAAGLGLFTLRQVWLYPGATQDLDAAISREPDSAFLIGERGRRRLLEGKIQAALPDLRLAADLNPRLDRRLDLAKAVVLSAPPDKDLLAELDRLGSLRHGWIDPVRWKLLRTAALLRMGDAGRAAASYAEAQDMWLTRGGLALSSTRLDREVQERLNRTDRELERILGELLQPLPVADQLALLKRERRDSRGRKPPWQRLLADPDWWVIEAERRQRVGDMESFLAAARQSLEAPLSDRTAAKLASLCRASKDPDVAASVMRRVASARPADPGVLTTLAALSAGLGNKEEARGLMEKASRLAAPLPPLLAFGVYRELGDTDRAKGLLEGLVREKPDDPGPRLFLAGLAMDEGHLPEARAHLRAAASKRLGTEDLVFAAELLRKMGDFREAFGLLREAASSLPPDAGARLSWARQAAEAGLQEDALFFADRMLEARPNPAQRLACALLLQRFGKWSEAASVLDGLVAEHPGQALYLSNRGVVRALMGRAKDAETDLRHAISADADLLQSYLSLGTLLAGSDRKSEALAVYDQALARKPKGRESLRRTIIKARAEVLGPAHPAAPE